MLTLNDQILQILIFIFKYQIKIKPNIIELAKVVEEATQRSRSKNVIDNKVSTPKDKSKILSSQNKNKQTPNKQTIIKKSKFNEK